MSTAWQPSGDYTDIRYEVSTGDDAGIAKITIAATIAAERRLRTPTEAAIDKVKGKGSDPVELVLDLWRLPAEGVPVESSSIDLSGIAAAQPGLPLLGIAASPEGRRVVWLTVDGRVKVTDFGIAKALDTSEHEQTSVTGFLMMHGLRRSAKRPHWHLPDSSTPVLNVTTCPRGGTVTTYLYPTWPLPLTWLLPPRVRDFASGIIRPRIDAGYNRAARNYRWCT